MIYEICAVVATIVLAALAYYIIQNLRELQQTLKQVNDLVARAQTKIDPISLETIRLLKNSNSLTESVNDKLDSFDPLFNSINKATSVLEEKTNSLAHNIHYEKNGSHPKDTVSNVIEIVAASILLWQQLKKGR